MVRKLLISALLVCIGVPALARVDTAWVRRYDGPGNDYDATAAVAVDGSGNVYVTGYCASFATLADYATVKYRRDGSLAWVRTYDGPASGWDAATAIALDTSGNVFVTGSSYGNAGGMDYATLKYDSLGNCLFSRRYNGPGDLQDVAQAVTVDDSGYVYVTGYSRGGDTHYDYATIKYSPSGATAWVARYNGPGDGSDAASDIVVDKSGFIYVTGTSVGIETSTDYATVKYLPNGDTAWVRRHNGSGNGEDGAAAIAVDGLGNVYVTGKSYQDTGESDYVTIKYLPNGDTAWVRRYNGLVGGPDEAYALAVDAFGYVYVTGTTNTNPG